MTQILALLGAPRLELCCSHSLSFIIHQMKILIPHRTFEIIESDIECQALKRIHNCCCSHFHQGILHTAIVIISLFPLAQQTSILLD